MIPLHYVLGPGAPAPLRVDLVQPLAKAVDPELDYVMRALRMTGGEEVSELYTRCPWGAVSSHALRPQPHRALAAAAETLQAINAGVQSWAPAREATTTGLRALVTAWHAASEAKARHDTDK